MVIPSFALNLWIYGTCTSKEMSTSLCNDGRVFGGKYLLWATSILLSWALVFNFSYGQPLFVALDCIYIVWLHLWSTSNCCFGCIYIRLYLSYHMYISGAPEQEGHIIESGAHKLIAYVWSEISKTVFKFFLALILRKLQICLL